MSGDRETRLERVVFQEGLAWRLLQSRSCVCAFRYRNVGGRELRVGVERREGGGMRAGQQTRDRQGLELVMRRD